MNCAQFNNLIEDYVAGDLSDAEREVLDEHARGCADCRRTLQELEEGAALLRLAVPQIDPPAALRQRILIAAAPVEVGPTAPAAPVERRPARRLRWRPRLALAHVAAALSALSLLLALGLGGWIVALQGEISQQAAENARLRDQASRQRDALYVLMSPTTVERNLVGSEAAPTARGTLYFDPPRRQGMVIASDLPPPAPDRTYQVWLRSKDSIIHAGFLRFDEHGTAYAILETPAPLEEFEAIGVSLEPVGGSPQPSGPRMLLGSLQS